MDRRTAQVGVREGYDRWAPTYGADDNPLLTLDERFVPRLLGELAGRDVLELACGTGRHTAALVQSEARVTAIDFSPGMLALARARVPGAVFVEGDLTAPLPFADAAFDVVLCCLALEHVAALEGVLREAGRVLRSGGRVVASDMHPAMRLRGNQASFDEGDLKVEIDGHAHPVSSYVMAAVRAGLRIEHLAEHDGDDALVAVHPRSAKYLGWPMLVTMRFGKGLSRRERDAVRARTSPAAGPCSSCGRARPPRS